MSEYAFLSTGDEEKDLEIARRIDLHNNRMAQNICPNGCGQMIYDDPHNRHCPKCNFSVFSTTPFDQKAGIA